MSYNLTLQCGCVVYVSCHPRTGVAHTRIIERRGTMCRQRMHDRGARLWLWDLLPSDGHAQPYMQRERLPRRPHGSAADVVVDVE
jgi:hypothetical protein